MPLQSLHTVAAWAAEFVHHLVFCSRFPHPQLLVPPWNWTSCPTELIHLLLESCPLFQPHSVKLPFWHQLDQDQLINPTYSVQYPVLVIICNYAHFTEIHSSLKARQLKSPKSNFLVPRSNSCFFNNLPVLFSFQLAIKRDLYITKLISGWLQHCLKAYICPKQPGWIDFVCSGSLF